MPLDAIKEQEGRTQRARVGLEQGTITVAPDSDGWRVRNGEGGTYRVTRDADRWSCTCPDHEHIGVRYGIRCKHIEAVRLSASQENSPKGENTMESKTPETTVSQDKTMQEIAAALAAPFPADRVSWKPQTLSKDKKRALAVAYIDARDVAQRLDDVVGPFGWTLDHKQVGEQTLTGLAIRDPRTGEFICKWDTGFVGGAESTSDDDRMKARKGTISDGLKRAGVLWGIGRYLYRLPKVWVDYDMEHKKLSSTPTLPQWALPASERKPVTAKAKQAAERLAQPDEPPAPDGNGHHPPAPNGNGKALEEARAVICPLAPKEHPEYKGKTLGELMTLAPRLVEWIATTMASNGDPERQAAKRAASILLAATA